MSEFEKEFVPYEEALALKELGFDEPCICAFYQDGQTTDPFPTFVIIKDVTNSKIAFGTIKCTRPTYSQAFRWFREKYKLHSSINLGVSDEQDRSGLEYDEYIFVIEGVNGRDYDNYNTPKFSKSPEEAELACLRKLIEIVKNKQHE